MSFWGNWSWLYFIGFAIIIIGIIGCNIFKYRWRLNILFSDSIGFGVVVSLICLTALLVNACDYHDQKILHESKYRCIVNFNEDNKELIKTNTTDVLKKAVEINDRYFEIVDGEMRIKEYNFRYIKDDSWRGLVPINTNEIKGE